jgi:hypothetical protein
MLMLGPEVLELKQDPLRVVERLHPRVAQTRELLAERLVCPHVNEGVGHAILDARQHCEVVRCDNRERVGRERLQRVQGLLEEVLAFVVVLSDGKEACVAAAALRKGEYFFQQALNALKALPPNSLTVVATHNLAVLTGIQNRMPDALVHMRTYQALCKQLPRLSNAWMQPLDNTQWILLKLQDLWPQHQHEQVAREATSGLV